MPNFLHRIFTAAQPRHQRQAATAPPATLTTTTTMASTSQPWLEDLSEEWVTQPEPDSATRNSESPAVSQASQSAAKARSRLPRMRQSSGSFSEIQVRSIAKELRPPKQRGHERSLSDFDIPATSSPRAAPRDISCSDFSISECSLMQSGTIAHQDTVARSPVKKRGPQDTPEWRRRLVNGDGMGYGNQTDLFGPTGLENIFQKPAPGATDGSAQPKRRLGLLKSLTTVPSSPPPWPAVQQPKDVGQAANKHEQAHKADQKSPSQENTEQEQDTSACTQEPGPSQEARTVSGQIEYENENFSPVYLTMTANMNVSQAAKPVPNFRGSELANRLRQIGSPPPNAAQPSYDETALSFSREDSSLARLQDESLPEGLPTGTPEVPDVGRHVELRRGGYSREGSFRRKPLSPSPERPASEASNGHDGRVGTAQPKSSVKHPLRQITTDPTTPFRAHEQFLSPDRAKNSGSPLKLFDAHDTYTSNRIQRRLSQLEYKSEKGSSVKDSTTVESTKVLLPKTSRLSSVEERSMQNVDQYLPTGLHQKTPYRVGSFGQGELNRYQFSGDFSAISSDEDCQDDTAPDESPSTDVAPPGSRQPFKFHLDESPAQRTSSKSRRQVSGQRGDSVRNISRPKFVSHRKVTTPNIELDDSELAHEYAEGKRGPTSPFKNPTPKRRRTICSVDEDDRGGDGDVFNDGDAGSTKRSYAAIQAVVSRNHKDASQDPSNYVADSKTLKQRHILRPRNPTPSQRRREEIQAEIMEATEAFIMSSPKLNTIREQLEPSMLSDTKTERDRAKAVANQIAAFSMRRQNGARDKTRKRSVTTQDFLDEALKIMDFIRTKGRPTSGLGSLEETEAETELIQERNDRSSDTLTFDRPPSKEGRHSTWKEPNKQDMDAKIMNHLRKYQEHENDTFLNSSINSIRVSRLGGSGMPGESIVVEQNDIRITDNPNRHRDDDDDDEEEDRQLNSPQHTADTRRSRCSSFGQTIITNASRRSDHVATLAPEAVAHLIPPEVAGMSFDRDKNVWVRQKSPSKQHRREEQPSAMNESEDDPFGNIPDLTVEDTYDQDVKTGSPVRLQPTAETILEDTEKPYFDEEARPSTREGNGVAYTDTSSAPSKASNFGWSYPHPDTRATSWSTQAPRNLSTKIVHVPTTYAIPESDEDDVEHEIQYFEGRDRAPQSVQRPRVRDITISIAEREAPNMAPQSENPKQKLRQNEWGPSSAQKRSENKQSNWTPIHGTRALSHGQPSRLPIFSGDGDSSLLDDAPARNYRMQLSMNVSAPPLRNGRRDTLVATPSSPVKDVTFMLSELPEFTLNQIDEFDLPDRVIVKHDGSRFSKALEDRYAQGTAELVKALQDVEPDEPYWEDLRNVSLRKKDLSSLHRLDELCYQLEELDVSDNKINQVEGIPYSMRRLTVQNNCLTGLTSWSTLINLQHLDITGNNIDALDGLAELVHLRILKADNNKIKSLEGILHLDGLMELSIGRNEIDVVDFSRSNLKSLTDLDLRKNQLLEVRNLHCLPQLQHLNLDDNEIDEFPLVDTPMKPCKALRSIRLCRNRTRHLDVEKYFPKLESLYVDGNALTQVSGLEHLRHLRTFSAREQVLDSESDMEMCASNLVRNAEVRNLYLSLNPTYGLHISQHLLSLQRLELASMGLKELPSNFGQLTPNLRTVNLNFNSLTDLRPLLNIKRLSELLLVGNKLERLRANAMVLGKLGTLHKLDWRDNPLTLRFYAPASENRIMSLRHKPSEEQLRNRFVMPDGEVEADVQHLLRLDYETRIRRRVTEMMLANLCKSLRELDGLPFDKARVLVKDDVWERLLFLGVIQRKRADTAVETE
ncbi:Septation initiation network scaffold cdc11 [Pyrenophora seminiperda CCB06]|uniref:Septation initiation network scaffold cdc11 n=1 Tax=Pyrenophora seminiperda CCB06 TaxID=1302712 RepID=A0A3M7MGA9_9PLEO|nr:Septation initiation network scaffold cdc11 [Pyrenophora seminiperda CCB06]